MNIGMLGLQGIRMNLVISCKKLSDLDSLGKVLTQIETFGGFGVPKPIKIVNFLIQTYLISPQSFSSFLANGSVHNKLSCDVFRFLVTYMRYPSYHFSIDI